MNCAVSCCLATTFSGILINSGAEGLSSLISVKKTKYYNRIPVII
jgi:hypothetical protein